MSKSHLDGVFTNTQSVPQLDGLVPGARHDLAVISRERNAQHVLGMSNKAAGCGSPRKTDTGVKMGTHPKLLTDQKHVNESAPIALLTSSNFKVQGEKKTLSQMMQQKLIATCYGFYNL